MKFKGLIQAVSVQSNIFIQCRSAKLQESKQGMSKIVESAAATGEIISSLASKTDQIREIAQVIDDIADQTNLLALNAAIEAA